MTQFKAGSSLTTAIKHLLDGEDVRCAVAFWGNGADALIQRNSRHTRIICDVTLGGTSPEALRALGAPDNPRLRCVAGFHAKIYISNRGAVVGSANASQNGIGFGGPAVLVEGGVLLAPENEAYHQTATWFEEQWNESEQVDESALNLATRRFRPERNPGRRAARAGSLLDLIAADPDCFSDVSIVLVESSSTQVDRDEVRAAVKGAYPKEIKDIDDLADGGIFTGWEPRDLNRWRRTFIEMWMPRKRLSVCARKVAYFSDSKGSLMSRSANWASIRKLVEIELPTLTAIAQTDGQMVRQLLDEYGGKIFSASELAAEIKKRS